MASKHNPLSLVPYGFVVTRSWLIDQGLGRHTVDNWLRSGQIVAVARGVCKRANVNKLTWQRVVCSLQRMGSDLTPGGLTALTLLAHYRTLRAPLEVHYEHWSRKKYHRLKWSFPLIRSSSLNPAS